MAEEDDGGVGRSWRGRNRGLCEERE